MAFSLHQITGNTKTEISPDNTDFKSMVFTNNHATAAVTIDNLYLVDQTGSYLRQVLGDLGVGAGTPGISLVNIVNKAGGYLATSSSQVVVVDTVNATAEIFLNEKVWKSDSTLVGTCTAVGSTTALTFGGGLEIFLANNTGLYTGQRYHVLNNVVIPNGASLKLENSDIGFDTDKWALYVVSSSSAGNLDVAIRY